MGRDTAKSQSICHVPGTAPSTCDITSFRTILGIKVCDIIILELKKLKHRNVRELIEGRKRKKWTKSLVTKSLVTKSY